MSQPTLSRIENAPSWRELARRGLSWIDPFCASFKRVPEPIVLEIDHSDDTAHRGSKLEWRETKCDGCFWFRKPDGACHLMGMFDEFIPVPPLCCPACGKELHGWQGKGGEDALMVWQQGVAAPIGQSIDDEDIKLEPEQLAAFRLPERFAIYTFCCSDRNFFVEAECYCSGETWSRTDLVTAEEARQYKQERRGVFRARLRWLSGKTVASEHDRTLDQEPLPDPLSPPSATEGRDLERVPGILAQQVLARPEFAGLDACAAITAAIAEIDRQLSRQLNPILHHADFQSLEGTWRGLHRLVANAPACEDFRIVIFNLSKKELSRTCMRFKAAMADNPLFALIDGQSYGELGGVPYSCVVGDYELDHEPRDMGILWELGKICSQAHTVFLAAASPSLLYCQTWAEALAQNRDVAPLLDHSGQHAAWRALRADQASQPIGLAVPRFLARAPYGAKTVPIEAFRFEEDLGDGSPSHFLWSNAAYLMAINIAHAFVTYGWCARICGFGSDGRIDGLSCFQAPGLPSAPDRVGPTEIAMGEGQEQQLAAQGLMPLIRTGDKGSAAFPSAPLLHKPAGVDRSEAGDEAPLSPSLAPLLTVNRFARAVKSMLDGRLQPPLSATDLQVLLERWIDQYVDVAPDEANSAGAKRPLSDASIEIEEIAGEPKRYRVKIRIQPHYQFDGQRVPMEVSTVLRFS